MRCRRHMQLVCHTMYMQVRMYVVLLVSVLLVGSSANSPKDDVQLMNLKSVKGGGGSYVYRGGDNFNRFYNNTQQGYGQVNHTAVNREVGVCYVEVPTATLVRDPKHIPAGNGSRSDLSRIRTCCAGYIRNIHNFHICDPVCTTECVNALCTAPDTCTCFPDHVQNLAGFCVATCPIGCQNGRCAGGECLCRDGFKLDVAGRFCVPHCRDNCAGVGNCTAPNTCACKPGYTSTPDGSCRPGAGPTGSYPQPGATVQTGSYPHPGGSSSGSPQQCGSCVNGYCVGTECRCRPGYLIYRGECKALCNPNCGPNLDCIAPNVCGPKSNTTQPHNTNFYPNGSLYPHPNQSNNSTYQNPNQYPNGQYPQNQNQYPYPNQGSNQYPHPNSQNPDQYPGNPPQNNTNQQYPNPSNQYSGQYQPNPIYVPYPGQQNHYPGQQNHYPHNPHPNQPNETNYPNHGQYPQQPGQQHIYPDLPTNPQTNQGGSNATGVYYQNPQYNPLENLTFNLQQGRPEQGPGQGQNVTQGQQYGGGSYSQGQYGQGQYSNGQNSQGQFTHGQTYQGQYSQGQGQYGQGQYSQGQYGQGQYSQGQYGQGQYGQGQYNQGQYGQGQYHQGQNFGQPGPYGQSGLEGQHDTQISNNGAAHCDQPCLNGLCVGLNTCQCFTGYNLDPADPTGIRCIPHCPGGCPNGYCSSPNNCLCMEGYQKDFSVKGRSGCIKRVRRSTEEKPVNIADLLVFEIPDNEQQ